MPQATQNTLTGCVALVTGASRGLGRGFACGLATAGASVALIARSRDQLDLTVRAIDERGGRAVGIVADVTDADAVTECVERAMNELGPIDLLVNNAGVMAPIGHDWEVDPKAWWRTMEVNVFGCFLCTRAVLPGMIERERGRIINISSSAATKRYPVYSAYGTSKAAVTHLTGSLAEATHRYGIRVFALAPGFVRTEMTESLADAAGIRKHVGDGFRRALDEGRHTPLSVAVGALLFLASGSADALSGAHIDARDDVEKLARQAQMAAAALG